MLTQMAGTARRLGRYRPDSRRGRRIRRGRLGGSSIAAVIGKSPWSSPYSEWALQKGLVQPDPTTASQSRGNYLEPALLKWYADQHPEFRVRRGGTYVNVDRDYHLASPDGLCFRDGVLVEGVEAKTDADADGSGWGRPGTDEVPIYYRVQVVWYMDAFGVKRWRVVLLDGRLQFREYVVEYDPAEAQVLRDAAEDFLASVFWDEMPELDEHPATYATVRKLHPKIDRDATVQLPAELAAELHAAVLGMDAAESRKRLALSKVGAFMGTARRAMHGGYDYALRQLSSKGLPYVKPDNKLDQVPPPDLPDDTTEEAA
ncbi:YqaJ viral recombinase family protein [Nonomuraea sp. NPDC001636]|uniref:YqaJ viral recombinase family protein n=1 Tax=Nonomuraea sp. NPDC001636 TaxID=3154391 RepID=UPI00331FFEA1